MNNGAKIGIVLGVGAAAALAWYLYNKNKAVITEETITTTTTTTPSALPAASPSVAIPAAASPVPAAQQTIFKDRDGNVFQLLTSSENKYGFDIKVNGRNNGSGVSLEIGSDGYAVHANKQGKKYVWKNNGWQ